MKKRIHCRLMGGLGLIVLAITAQASEQQWLRYCTARDARQALGSIGAQRITLSTNKPAHLECPKAHMNTPLFGQWLTPMAESGRAWMALNRSQESGPYDELLIDSNMNGSLVDEHVVRAHQIEPLRSRFGPARVVFDTEEGPVAYHLNCEFSNYNNRRNLSVISGGWYEGTITVDGQERRCMLIDHNANGTFNDTSDTPDDCDAIRIGEKDDFKTSKVGSEIVIGAVVYRLEIARDGAFIKLAAAEYLKYGAVLLPQAMDELQVKSQNKVFRIHPQEGKGRLPEGRYQIQLWRTKRRDEDGHLWTLAGQDFGGNGWFEVNEGGQTNLRIGEPVTCTVHSTKSDATRSFNLTVRGRLGERIKLTQNGSQPWPPRLHIKDTTGTYDRTYSFKYG